jgi:hypothetical protein
MMSFNVPDGNVAEGIIAFNPDSAAIGRVVDLKAVENDI